MWHDIEAKVDLLNFSLVAEAAAQLIRDSGGAPLTIGVSGGWGAGKSSLVKMVGQVLEADENAEKRYVFLEFNAWLYQGFDDARQALLQAVSDRLLEVAEERKSFVDEVVAFRHRIKWLRLGRIALPAVAGMLAGGALGGPIGAVVGAAGGLAKAADDVGKTEALEKLQAAYAELQPELKELIRDRTGDSLPKEIQGLRDAFADILGKLDVTLVVLVDDLDRCLPNTAIATLEAMRLLLHVPRTAFIVAADEQMIRSAVRVHFGDVDIGNDLVTSYFDKLIQVPLRVPRLGINEVKVYVALLLAQLAERRGKLKSQALADAQATLLTALKRAWSGGITHDVLKRAFGDAVGSIQVELDMAEQLAPLLVSAEQIAGNPRLIKRFLNNLVIRDTVAKAQGMTTGFDTLVKMQLFERCASPAAFEYLAKVVSSNDEGQAPFLAALEGAAAKGEPYAHPDASWSGSPFYEQWVRLSPTLADTNLKPFIYLSRDRAPALASYDELSQEARGVFEAALTANEVLPGLTAQFRTLSEQEAERVLVRLLRKAQADNWSAGSLARCFNCVNAHESTGATLAATLSQIPAKQVPTPIAPLLRSKPWATELIAQWQEDKAIDEGFKKALANKGRG